MKSSYLVLLLVLALPIVGLSQISDAKKLFLFSSAGLNIPGLSEFNSVLTSNGFGAYGNAFLATGGGFMSYSQRSGFGSIFHFNTFNGNKSRGNQNNSIRGTQVGSALAYVFNRKRPVHWVVYGGVNVALLSARFSAAPNNANTFTTYLASTADQLHVQTRQFMGNAGLQWVRELGNKPEGKARPIIGFRAGYYMPFAQPTWRSLDRRLDGGPNANIGGFYFSGLLGMGR